MNAEAIFDAVGKLGALSMLHDKRAKKAQQLKNVQAKKCGNCYHWMKSSCEREKKFKEFKSCESMACKDFELSDLGGLIPLFTEELEEIEQKIADFK